MRNPSEEAIREAVVARYGAIARRYRDEIKGRSGPESGCGCGPSCCAEDAAPPEAADASTCGVLAEVDASSWVEQLYSARERDEVEEAVAGMTLGSGNPVALAELAPGETVLDLGSGAGMDCFLAARRVGPTGRVIGVDMTPDMIELARANLERVGADNVEFRQGTMEKLPVPTAAVDVVISNCVINLSPDKFTVFREAFRVLKPGGRFRVSDILWTRIPTEEERNDLSSWAGCLAGALTVQQVTMLLDAAGFVDVRIEGREKPAGRGWMSAEVSARKP